MATSQFFEWRWIIGFSPKSIIAQRNLKKWFQETLRKSNSSESRGDFHIKPYIFEAKLNDNGDGYFGDFFYIDARKSNSKTSSSINEGKTVS